MKDERWTVADRLLGAALEREPHERAAFLSGACGDDEELRREVESLLAHERDAGDFLVPSGAGAGGNGTEFGASAVVCGPGARSLPDSRAGSAAVGWATSIARATRDSSVTSR